LPVLLDLAASTAPAQEVPGRQLADSLEDRVLSRRVEERQVVVERGEVEARFHRAGRKERLDLAAEVQAAAALRVMQRLLPGAVAREQQRPSRLVPQRDAEHAAKAPERVFAPRLVRMHDRLGVARRVEAVPERLELGAELAIVVDLAVEDDPDRAGLVVDRLPPAGQIDDAQATHAEAHAGADMDAFVIRAAVPDHLAHAVHEVELRFLPRRRQRPAALGDVGKTGYSTHVRSSCSMHG
jgi:hypothetical protein